MLEKFLAAFIGTIILIVVAFLITAAGMAAIASWGMLAGLSAVAIMVAGIAGIVEVLPRDEG